MGRIFRQHAVIVRERFIDAAEFETGVGEIVEDFRMIRRNQQGVAIVCYRLLKASRRMKREPKIGHRIRRTGIDLERLRQETQRLDEATALQVEKAEQLECIEIFAAGIPESRHTAFRPCRDCLAERNCRPAAACGTDSARRHFSNSPTTGISRKHRAFSKARWPRPKRARVTRPLSNQSLPGRLSFSGSRRPPVAMRGPHRDASATPHR